MEQTNQTHIVKVGKRYRISANLGYRYPDGTIRLSLCSGRILETLDQHFIIQDEVLRKPRSIAYSLVSEATELDEVSQ